MDGAGRSMTGALCTTGLGCPPRPRPGTFGFFSPPHGRGAHPPRPRATSAGVGVQRERTGPATGGTDWPGEWEPRPGTARRGAAAAGQWDCGAQERRGPRGEHAVGLLRAVLRRFKGKPYSGKALASRFRRGGDRPAPCKRPGRPRTRRTVPAAWRNPHHQRLHYPPRPDSVWPPAKSKATSRDTTYNPKAMEPEEPHGPRRGRRPAGWSLLLPREPHAHAQPPERTALAAGRGPRGPKRHSAAPTAHRHSHAGRALQPPPPPPPPPNEPAGSAPSASPRSQHTCQAARLGMRGMLPAPSPPQVSSPPPHRVLPSSSSVLPSSSHALACFSRVLLSSPSPPAPSPSPPSASSPPQRPHHLPSASTWRQCGAGTRMRLAGLQGRLGCPLPALRGTAGRPATAPCRSGLRIPPGVEIQAERTQDPMPYPKTVKGNRREGHGCSYNFTTYTKIHSKLPTATFRMQIVTVLE